MTYNALLALITLPLALYLVFQIDNKEDIKARQECKLMYGHHPLKMNSCSLPDDFSNFYLATNGLRIQWSAKVADKISPIGNVEISAIDMLARLDYIIPDDIRLDDIEDRGCDSYGNEKPSLKDGCFQLNYEPDFGKVCLVYKKSEKEKVAPQIWFLDRSFQWHFLAATFTQYFRMLIIHMGIVGWQYYFTDVGITPEVKKWFHYFIPHCLSSPVLQPSDISPSRINEVDFACLYSKSKAVERKKNETSKPAKTAIKPKQSKSSIVRSSLKNSIR